MADRIWTVVRFPNGSWSYGGKPDSPDYEHCEVWQIVAESEKGAVKKAQAKRGREIRKRNAGVTGMEALAEQLKDVPFSRTPGVTVPAKVDVSEAMARYLRRCRSGGLTNKQSDLISGAVEDAQRLGYFDVPTGGVRVVAKPDPTYAVRRLMADARSAMLRYGTACKKGDEEGIRSSTTDACAALDGLAALAYGVNGLPLPAGRAGAEGGDGKEVGNTTCNPHPDAPHGFNRNASHNAGRHVCDCEGWMPHGVDVPRATDLEALAPVTVEKLKLVPR